MNKEGLVAKKEKIKNFPDPQAAPALVPLKTNEKAGLLFLILFASVLIFTNLGGTYLWRDEASTALLGKTILQHGLPKGTDGFNSFSGDPSGEKSDMNQNGTWILTPWFPYYLAAPLTVLPPEGNEWALRLPFALFGLATLPLVFFTARRFFDTRTAWITVCFLVLYVPFLLYSRQCRYYAPAMFFSVYFFYAYDKLIKGERHAAAHFFISQLFLFHTQYMIWAVAGASAAVHFFISGYKKAENFLFLGVICAAVNLPWIALFRQKAAADMQVTGIETYVKLFPKYIAGLNDLLPLAFVLIAAVIMLLSKKEEGVRKPALFSNKTVFIIILIAANVVIASMTSGFFFRYFVGIIPAVMMLNALLADFIFRKNKALGVVLAGLLVFTNLLSLPVKIPAQSLWREKIEESNLRKLVHFPFFQYLYEITHEYRGPIRGIIETLRKSSKDGQTVLAADGDFSIKYYLPRLRVYGGLSGDNGEREASFDWLIPRRYAIDPAVRKTNKRISELAKSGGYERLQLTNPDYVFENSPEPRYHLFKTAENVPPVVIYKKSG